MRCLIRNIYLTFFCLLFSFLIYSADVTWLDKVNVDDGGGTSTLTKTAGNGWNAGAVSDDGFTGDGILQFEATDSILMCGLSADNPDNNYTSIDYAIYIHTNSNFYVYENGSRRGTFGQYNPGDIFQVRRTGDIITYYRNAVLFYTSSVAAPSATGLFADCSLYSDTAELRNTDLSGITVNPPAITKDLKLAGARNGEVVLNWTAAANNSDPVLRYVVEYGAGDFSNSSPDIAYSPVTRNMKTTVSGLNQDTEYTFRVRTYNASGNSLSNVVTYRTKIYHEVLWLDQMNVDDGGGTSTLTKTANNGWNAGGVSNDGFTGDGTMQFEATDAILMCGLSEKNTDNNYTSINYAIYIHTNGNYYVYENGSRQGTFGQYAAGDLFQIRRLGSQIIYYRNNESFYVSSASSPAGTGLFADCSLNSSGAVLKDAVLCDVALNPPGEINDLTLAGAESGQVNLIWTAAANNTVDIDRYVVEYGAGNFNTVSADIPHSLTTKNMRATISGLLPDTLYSFRVRAYNSQGDSLSNVLNYSTIIYHDVLWLDQVNVDDGGGTSTLIKNSGNGWNGGGVSNDGFTGDGTLQFEGTDSILMCGLSEKNRDNNYTSINYALYIHTNHNVYVYENGSRRGTFGQYVPGDIFQIKRIGNTISYYKNNQHLYTSPVPSLPEKGLFADCSLNNSGAVLQDVSLSEIIEKPPGNIDDLSTAGANRGAVSLKWTAAANNTDDILRYVIEYGESDFSRISADIPPSLLTKNMKYNLTGLSEDTNYQFRIRAYNSYGDSISNVINYRTKKYTDVHWIDQFAVDDSGGTNSLTKTSGNGWNAGAVSQEGFTGDGTLQFEATDSILMCGFSETNPDNNYTSINYALYIHTNANIYVYENGSRQGTFGQYVPGDLFQVKRIGSIISYYKNNELLYSSSVPCSPERGLFADCSLHSSTAVLKDVTFSDITGKVPGAINDLVGTEDNGSIRLHWSRAADNLFPITNYQVQYGSIASGQFSGSLDVDPASNPGSSKLSALLGGLTNGLAYQIRVISYNLYGESAASNIVTILPIAGEYVMWRNKARVFDSETDVAPALAEYYLEKNGNGWNGGGFSINSLAGNGAVQFEAAENSTLMCGFSETDTDLSYSSINYALYIHTNGNVYIYENGSRMATIGNYSSGDIFQVERVGSTVKYKQNGLVIYESTVPNTNELFADCSLYHSASLLKKTKFLEYPPLADFYGIADTVESRVTLFWTNPTPADDPDFTGTMIRYSLDDFPQSVSDGILLGEFDALTSSAEHNNVLSEETYYYSAFARNISGNYTYPVVTHVLTNDLIAPDPVSDLNYTAGVESVTLKWINPDTFSYPNQDLAGVLIKRSEDSFPLTENDGDLVVRLMNGEQQYTDTSLEPGKTYYYSVFTFDEVPYYSEAVKIAAVPDAGVKELVIVPAALSSSYKTYQYPSQTAGIPLTLKIVALNESGGVAAELNENLEVSFTKRAVKTNNVDDLTFNNSAFPDSVSLNFTSGISESFVINYYDSDFLEIKVFAEREGMDESDGYVSIIPAQIVFYPYAFYFEKEENSSVHEIAGKPFNVSLKAVAADNTNNDLSDNKQTEGYSSASIKLFVESYDDKVMAGELSPATIDMSSGVINNLELVYNAVGKVRLQAVEDSSGYEIRGESPVLSFSPASFSILLKDPPLERNYYYENEELTLNVSPLNFYGAVLKSYNNQVIIESGSEMEISNILDFTEEDQGIKAELFTVDTEGLYRISLYDNEYKDIRGESDEFEIKFARIEIADAVTQIGRDFLVKVKIVDLDGNLLSEDNNTAFYAEIEEENNNGSVKCAAVHNEVKFSNGTGVFYISNEEIEAIKLSVKSEPYIVSDEATIRFTSNSVVVSEGGIRIDYWYENK